VAFNSNRGAAAEASQRRPRGVGDRGRSAASIQLARL